MTAPTLDHQIAELKRELALRKNVYPKCVASGKMRQSEADLSTARMTSALHTVMAVKRLRATLVKHRYTGEGVPACSCGFGIELPGPSDESVGAWIDHVFERSKAAEEQTGDRTGSANNARALGDESVGS